MICHREVQPVRCEKCNGTGQIVGHDDVGMFMAPCPHLRRTDATGLDDDTERILDLERRLCETMAAVDRARDEGLEMAAQKVEAYYGAWEDEGYDLAARIRAMKGGGG